ncbi:shikimate dehydrogenase [Hydrogenimonas thermophila]|uniref:shikimate dehydrogenase n=1 Tax=Hydrogenimonas thermophila TaxID=223786 RepID=UPI0029372BCC|nr:shikimate dehydrogenase [Hydrogenimonas thermophila]WOE70917.1 shikimate dehydrogenase [Hydrogenimonas thermophila]WOE73435.1 shikimate dehydrogenase [Hydrogenimonas thermophila]
MKLFTIFGNPVSHSKSPLMHNLAFKTLGFNGCYGRWQLVDGTKLRDTFIHLGLNGCNITVPHKEEAFKAADIVEPFAAEVQAVNTLVLKNNKLYGYNTDAPGFYRALEKLGTTKSALIIGAGGTARALALYLRSKDINIEVVNRSERRLKWFKDEGFVCHTWDSFNPSSKDVVINTTSAGLSDESLPMPKELLDQSLKKAKYAVDVIYGKDTPFLKEAKKLTLPFFDGSEMLLQQGIIAFDYFTDHQYTLDEIETAMRPFLSL